MAAKKATSKKAERGTVEDLEKRLASTARQLQDAIKRAEMMEKQRDSQRERADAWEDAGASAFCALTQSLPGNITPETLVKEAKAVRAALDDAGVDSRVASAGVIELHRELRSHIVRSTEPIEVELGRKADWIDKDMPAIFTDAPLARDADANQAAPTIPLSMYEALFPKMNKDASPENLGEAREYPPWCALAVLSSFEEKDRGRLLSFQLVGETNQRVMWVRA